MKIQDLINVSENEKICQSQIKRFRTNKRFRKALQNSRWLKKTRSVVHVNLSSCTSKKQTVFQKPGFYYKIIHSKTFVYRFLFSKKKLFGRLDESYLKTFFSQTCFGLFWCEQSSLSEGGRRRKKNDLEDRIKSMTRKE